MPWGARFSIVVVAEGAQPAGGDREIMAAGTADRMERLGGIAAKVSRRHRAAVGQGEAATSCSGHLQRGGSPTSYDRVLATRFGAFAVELLHARQVRQMVALRSPEIVAVPIEKIVGRTRNVPIDGDLVRTARNVGISFGD